MSHFQQKQFLMQYNSFRFVGNNVLRKMLLKLKNAHAKDQVLSYKCRKVMQEELLCFLVIYDYFGFVMFPAKEDYWRVDSIWPSQNNNNGLFHRKTSTSITRLKMKRIMSMTMMISLIIMVRGWRARIVRRSGHWIMGWGVIMISIVMKKEFLRW